MSDPALGEGTAQLSLTEQAQNSLTGTWSVAFKNGGNFSGPATAGVFSPAGYGVVLYVNPPPACGEGPGGSTLLGFTLTNVAITSNKLTAVAGRTSCSGIAFGTVNLSRQ
jgi:hypothetical protein